MIYNFILKQKISTQGLGIALGGGAVRGFFHIGVLKALEEFSINISYITGISIGSLVGGLYAYGYTAQQVLDILDQHIPFNDLLSTLTLTPFNKSGIFSGKKMIQEINTLVKNTPIQHLKIPFACRAVDLIHFKEVIYDKDNLGTAVKASCAIPGFFTPEINQESAMLVDGGVLGPVPIKLLKEKFKGPVLCSNLISYNNIDTIDANKLIESFSTNVIYKFVPVTENILRSLYLMQSYISDLETEKYKPDIVINFDKAYNPSIANITDIKDMLINDGYEKTKTALYEIGFTN